MGKVLIPTLIEATNLSDSWFQCIKAVLSDKNTHRYVVAEGGSFAGQERLELDLAIINILKPGMRPLTPFTPQGILAPCSEDYFVDYLPYLLTSERHPKEEYTYGQYLELQIPKAIEMFKNTDEGNNQVCMRIGNDKSIFLGSPPCLVSIDCRLLDNKLSFLVQFRSWDLWGGYPANLGALQILKEHMAEEIGVEDGQMLAVSKGLHLYDHCWELGKAVLGENNEIN